MLEKKYKVQVSDPVSKPGDSLKFLKKDITVTKDGLVISLDDKYLSKLCELLNITNPRHRRVPCTQDILGRDESPELSAAQASVYRAAIGSLLYISPERPDAQFAIGALARCMSRPVKTNEEGMESVVHVRGVPVAYETLRAHFEMDFPRPFDA